ncbi:hypothetical protein H5410_005012 [Solanum commersonii]|uniref:Uncharacterized protein n=1 Tax=Solanum commersonii TaxID=4109 RepID=A0A9J6A601_SOLCO|nr:hypothetical protein H5410_005012 [Solanum commersonii]
MAYLLDTCYSTRPNWDKTKSLSKQTSGFGHVSNESPIAISESSIAMDELLVATDH